MRIVSYNILEGGAAREGSPDRTEAIAAILSDLRPDILALVEAKGWSARGCRPLYDMEAALGMRGFLAASETGFHTALFLRAPLRPLRVEDDSRHFYHGMLRVKFGTDEKHAWTVAVVHLNPFSPDARRIETAHLVARARCRPRTLIMGDFNSPSDHDVERGLVNEATLESLPARYRLRYGWWKADGSALANIERAGFVDLFRRLHEDDLGHTVPTRIGSGAEFGGMRLDYIWASDDVAQKAKSCVVLRDPRTDKASDHYPLVAEVDL